MANKINLDELKKRGLNQDPFPAPKGYFNDFSQRMQQRIEDTKTEEGKVVSISSRWYYAAAAIAVLVVAVWLTNPFQTSTTPVAEVEQEEVQTLLADVSEQELIDFIQLGSVDVISTVLLTEDEQEDLLEAELESYDLPEEYYLDTDYLLEEYL
ncbi:hypothetical protein [Tunicatimonas pelagia]|uniref:hypothetical protein n=1 Tax=Tunicatimonas pelagia TaxID=931531 RepID=UPI00266719E2|nr:hypothetical protein [Tunicatimonas pelagia]WKN46127.1 hypothetical protein P0M28_14325 [Tunicatimonas pelagia]